MQYSLVIVTVNTSPHHLLNTTNSMFLADGKEQSKNDFSPQKLTLKYPEDVLVVQHVFLALILKFICNS